MQVLRDEDHAQADVEELGSIVVKLPLPPAAFSTLYKNEDTFKQLYFSKFPVSARRFSIT